LLYYPSLSISHQNDQSIRKINDSISIKELIIDESVLADVTFNEKSDEKFEDLFEDEGDEESEVDVVGCDVEDVHEVYEVEEQQEFVA
jgi:hypothetical protein